MSIGARRPFMLYKYIRTGRWEGGASGLTQALPDVPAAVAQLLRWRHTTRGNAAPSHPALTASDTGARHRGFCQARRKGPTAACLGSRHGKLRRGSPSVGISVRKAGGRRGVGPWGERRQVSASAKRRVRREEVDRAALYRESFTQEVLRLSPVK